MERRVFLRSLAAAGTVGTAGCLRTAGSEPTTTTERAQFRIETVTMGLEVPWGAAFAADGDLYVTERPGRVHRIARDSERRELVADFTDRVAARGEAGLLGLAFHPDDADLAYTYQTARGDSGLANRVVRHRVSRGFEPESVVVDGIPGASTRNGGRLAFGPDGALYVATGDAGVERLAGDTGSLAGKVLRLTPDGDPHPDNPFGNATFTYGHRNPVGLAWRAGTPFVADRYPDADEIDRLQAGSDYGWPAVAGASDGRKSVDPVATPSIGVGGAAFYHGPITDWRGDLFAGGLSGAQLRRIRLGDRGDVLDRQVLLDDKYGRLRTVFTGPDASLYVTTSNRDGADDATPAPQDDRVLRIRPA